MVLMQRYFTGVPTHVTLAVKRSIYPQLYLLVNIGVEF